MEIKLFNRDGANLRLVSEDEKLWQFKVDLDHQYIFDYMRYEFAEDNKTIQMIDPSGGPYLTIGTKLNNDYVIDAFVEVDDILYIHTNKIE